jgi:hypothetical protein
MQTKKHVNQCINKLVCLEVMEGDGGRLREPFSLIVGNCLFPGTRLKGKKS